MRPQTSFTKLWNPKFESHECVSPVLEQITRLMESVPNLGLFCHRGYLKALGLPSFSHLLFLALLVGVKVLLTFTLIVIGIVQTYHSTVPLPPSSNRLAEICDIMTVACSDLKTDPQAAYKEIYKILSSAACPTQFTQIYLSKITANKPSERVEAYISMRQHIGGRTWSPKASAEQEALLLPPTLPLRFRSFSDNKRPLLCFDLLIIIIYLPG